MILFPCAKLNLTLDVTGRDDRGYHLLSSVFCEIDLHDTLTVAYNTDGILRFSCNLSELPTDRRNLVVRAYEDFFAAFPFEPIGLTCLLEKEIPSYAGLGGGSSDAAAMLKILASCTSVSLEDERLLALASSIGADVPFFLKGGMCLAEGTGEKLTPIPFPESLKDRGLLLVKSVYRASTPRVFGLYDEAEKTYAPDTPSFLDATRRGDDVLPFLGNHLTEAAAKVCPDFPELIHLMKSNGSLATGMTGSGSCLYGIFDSPAAARAAQRVFDKKRRFSRVCNWKG